MPHWLSDPSPTFTFILLLAAAIGVGIWYRYRDKSSLYRMIGIVTIVVTILIIGQVVDSPREEAVVRVKAMVSACNARDPKAFVDNMSDTFKTAELTKESMKTSGFWGLLKSYDVRVTSWDFSHADCEYPNDTSVVIGFMCKGESGNYPEMRYAKGTFVKDADGKYRLSNIKFYNAVKKTNGAEDPVPQFR